MDQKRPIWQWVIFYLVLALFVYGFVYYLIPSMKQSPSASQSAAPVPGQIVTYTDAGFSPAILTVKQGAVVTFTNASASDMRVAAGPHPLHDSYPTRGGCISSTFDSCGNIPSGGSWSFTFNIAGTWEYHNHLDPINTGTIVVQ